MKHRGTEMRLKGFMLEGFKLEGFRLKNKNLQPSAFSLLLTAFSLVFIWIDY